MGAALCQLHVLDGFGGDELGVGGDALAAELGSHPRQGPACERKRKGSFRGGLNISASLRHRSRLKHGVLPPRSPYEGQWLARFRAFKTTLPCLLNTKPRILWSLCCPVSCFFLIPGSTNRPLRRTQSPSEILCVLQSQLVCSRQY